MLNFETSTLPSDIENMLDHLSSGIGVIEIKEFKLIAANQVLKQLIKHPLLQPVCIERIFPEIKEKRLHNVIEKNRPYRFKINLNSRKLVSTIDVLIKSIVVDGRISYLLIECIHDKSKKEVDALIISYQKTMEDYKQQILEQKDHALAANIAKSLLLEHMNEKLESKVIQRTKDLERAHLELSYQANHDVLTNLPNRRLFDDRLSHSVHFCQTQKQPLALFYFDLDNFKKINDAYGHAVGDLLLQETALRISACLRESDIFCRIGGDEFSIILENTDQLGVVKVAEKMLSKLSPHFLINGHEIYTSVSIGICMLEDVLDNNTTLTQAADAAMYKVKSLGKNNYLFFSDVILKEQHDRANLEIDLRKAIDKKQFFLVYQPKIDLKTRAVIGCEALIRWQHPTKGILFPDLFIPIAEDIGLIADIGLWVLKQTTLQILDWRERELPIASVAVNLSGCQLNDPDCRRNILAILEQSNIDSTMLEFELTESVLMSNQSEGGMTFLRLLRDRGHAISIDDFGTGYSSLSYLQTLPVTTLKIDKSFVLKLTEDNQKQAALVSAILALAKIFNLSVVAEGVETEDQLFFLTEGKCDSGQGYLISKPISVAQIEAFSLHHQTPANRLY